MLVDFKKFLFRGNLLDLATAVVIGVAFGAVVTSAVEDVLTPLIAAVAGEPNFSRLEVTVGDGVIRYGNFLNALISFMLVAGAIFVVVRIASRAQKHVAGPDEPEKVPPASDEAVLLAEIRDLLRQSR